MKKLVSFLFVSAFFALHGCSGNGTSKAVEPSGAEAHLRLKVGGMTCTGCEKTIEAGLSQIDGIKSVDAVFTDSTATIDADTTKVSQEKIKSVIVALGYSVIE